MGFHPVNFGLPSYAFRFLVRLRHATDRRTDRHRPSFCNLKMRKNVLKWWTFELTGWITGKRLKIDRYMLRCFDKHWILFSSMWHLPRLSQGRTQRRPKCVLRLSWGIQMPPFTKRVELLGNVEDRYIHRWVHAEMLWQELNLLFIHVTFTAIEGEVNHIPAWLSWGSQIVATVSVYAAGARSVCDS